MRSIARLAIAAATVAVVTSCSDISSPTNSGNAPRRAISPDVAASLSKTGSASVPTLERDKPLGDGVSASATIGIAGGYVLVPAAGFTLYVPPGAVKKSTKFTVTALPGKLVAYEFEPHGTTFSVPVVATQVLRGTHMRNGKLDATALFAGYFADRSEADEENGQATIHEAFSLRIDSKLEVVVFGIPHFSGYIYASGRCANDE